MTIRLRALTALFSLLYMVNTTATTLHSITVKETPQITSIFCTLTDMPSYRSFMLNTPTRAVVDLNNTRASAAALHVPIASGLIKQIRTGHPNSQTLRLVFDLKSSARMQLVWLGSGEKNTQRLRIDLRTKANTMPSVVAVQRKKVNQPIRPKRKIYPVQKQAPLRPLVRKVPSQSLRDVVVVIDAGHGGKDPGATGAMRHVEKHVVLTIAKRLKLLIDRQPGMHAVLTRSGDYYIGLRQRLNIARRYNADLFVSIHADAFNNRNSMGASVYALSPKGATSEAARWLAEKENYSELGGVDLSGLDDKNGLIRTVLLDLSQTATTSAGLKVGSRVLHSLNRMTTLHHNKVEQARFVVLKSPDIPSILIETGFISNPREEYNLTNPAYQNRLTVAIFYGIKQYFWENPPHGSKVEAMLGGSTYTRNA